MFLTAYLVFTIVSLYSLYRMVYYDKNHGFVWIALISSILLCFVPVINFFTMIAFSGLAIGNTEQAKKLAAFLESDVKLNRK